MPNYRRAKTQGGTYFFTVVTHQRQPILCNKDFRHALRQAIETTRITQPFDIDAWVLLPDHLHCIWTLPAKDANFSARWSMIKRLVTKQCGKSYFQEQLYNASRRKRRESTLWQRRFWEHLIRDEDDYQRYMDYLHYNPVKHGTITKLKDWPYSSFHRYVKQGVYVKSWGDMLVVDTDGNFGE